ncbi:unnamed protein product [Porites lobata]|uniref:Uncharacterized protein n=1 Tax=Porites lobata TaxID=104759 RepID=A0ABN8NI90_9CNID|nr:unnamed protein product [Porites lobata]
MLHGKTRSLFTCYQLYLRVWRLVKWRGGSVAVLNAHIMYQGAGHQGVSLGDFKELLVEQLIGGNSFRRDTLSPNVPEHVPDVRFNREHFHYPCECVQHLALSAITLCSNISLMTRKGMGLKGSKMSMADQGLDQEDPAKGDQDK